MLSNIVIIGLNMPELWEQANLSKCGRLMETCQDVATYSFE
jgi:hypothetical protein